MSDNAVQFPIFRPGRHTTSGGETIEFTEARLAEIVEGYAARSGSAPLVIGHPKTDDPAWGWVTGLSLDDDGLMVAEFSDVDDEVRGAVAKHRFRHVSAAFYRPTDQHNPTPGKWALRHVGLLGATPPAVQGLGAVKFNDGDAFVEFAMSGEDRLSKAIRQVGWLASRMADFMRRQRETVLVEEGLEAADRQFPNWQIDAASSSAGELQALADESASPAFAASAATTDTEPEEDALSTEKDARIQELEAQLAASAAADAERRTTERHAANVAFCDGLVQTARLPQGARDQVVAILDHLDANPGETPTEFSAGDGSKTDASGALKDLLSGAKPAVTFGEIADEDTDPAPGVAFAMPAEGGYTLDPDAAALDRKAAAFATANGVPYAQAVIAVAGSN